MRGLQAPACLLCYLSWPVKALWLYFNHTDACGRRRRRWGCGAGNWLRIADVNAVSTDWWNCILVLGRIPTAEWTWGQAPGGWVTVWEKVEELWDEDRQMHGSQHAACIHGSCQVLFMIFFSCPKGKNKSGRILWKIVRIVLFSLKSRSALPKRKMMVYIFFHHYYYL